MNLLKNKERIEGKDNRIAMGEIGFVPETDISVSIRLCTMTHIPEVFDVAGQDLA